MGEDELGKQQEDGCRWVGVGKKSGQELLKDREAMSMGDVGVQGVDINVVVMIPRG